MRSLLLIVPMAMAAVIAIVNHATSAIAVACALGELVLVGFAAVAFTYIETTRLGRMTAAVAAVTSGACARAAFLVAESAESELAVLHGCSAVLSLMLAALIRRAA